MRCGPRRAFCTRRRSADGRATERAANRLKREQEPDHSGPTFGRLQVRNSLLHCRQDHSSEGRGATAVGRGTERMAVEALGSAPRVKVAPWNDPVIRGWVFQIVVVGLVGLLAWYLVSNTIDNLERQKIASGFHYLEREAGFEIGDTMIDYSPASTYARAIYVGMLNTLRVSVLGVIMATILGTLLGVGRLSNNWLLAKICEWYVEAFRNVPLLLWLFLFYKLISEAFPGPRQAIGVLWNSVYLSNRGLYFPVPIDRTDPQMDGRRASDRHRWRVGAAPMGEEAAGRDRPALPVDLRGLRPGDRPAVRGVAAGRCAASPELARTQRLQLRRRHGDPAGIHRPAARPRPLHLGLRRRDRALGHPGAAQGPERGRHGDRPDRAAR